MNHNVSAEELSRAVTLAGKKPINPIGACFDTVAFQAMHGEEPPPDLLVCHGIGIANMPGQEGLQMAHAWLEWKVGKKWMAYDTTWGWFLPRYRYRQELGITHMVVYNRDEFILLWLTHDYPGPFDPKIKVIADRGRE